MSEEKYEVNTASDRNLDSKIEALLFSIDRQVDSNQLEAEDSAWFSGMDVVEPPYNPLLWASLMEKNSRLNKLIRTFAKNTMGRGYRVIPLEPITKDTTEEDKKTIERQKKIIDNLFKRPTKNFLPFREIGQRMKIDEESTGNGYFEIVRDLEGKIAGIYHIPSHTMRIRKKGLGYVQIRDGKKVYFKPFGAEFDINKANGKKHPLGRLSYKNRASEVIQFLIYTPTSSYYGAPRHVGAAMAIAGNQLVGRRNLAFFKNDATPRLIISVSNGTLTKKSVDMVEHFVQTLGKGVDNSHRVMVLQAKSKQIGPDPQTNTKIDVTPLSVGITEDGSFLKYREVNDEELRECFGIGKVFLGSSNINRATSYVERTITNEQEFIPDIELKEEIINNTIVADLLKDEKEIKVKLEIIRPKSTDEIQEAEIFVRYLQGGGITPNDIRHKLNLPEFKEEWADMPIQVALIHYQMGLFGTGENTEEPGEDPQDQARNEDTTEDGTKIPNNDVDGNNPKDKIKDIVMNNINNQLLVNHFIKTIMSYNTKIS